MTTPVNLNAHLLDVFDFLPLSNRNYVVDGNFDQWATTSAAANSSTFAYGPALMYESYAGAGGAATIAQGVFPVGTEPAGTTSPVSNYYSHQQTTASTGAVGTNSPGIFQKVESVKTLQGRSATFSCWLWCTSGTQTITGVIASQLFGSGGSPSSLVIASPTVNWVLTTTPQRFSVRIDFPSIAGKTLGSNNNDCLQIGLWLPTGATYTINTMQWQLEQCSPQAPAVGLPTAFEYRGAAAELLRVQRYYVSDLIGLMGNGFQANVYVAGFYQLPVSMRAVPSVTLGTAVENVNMAAAPAVTVWNNRSLRLYGSSAAGGNVYWDGPFTADARL